MMLSSDNIFTVTYGDDQYILLEPSEVFKAFIDKDLELMELCLKNEAIHNFLKIGVNCRERNILHCLFSFRPNKKINETKQQENLKYILDVVTESYDEVTLCNLLIQGDSIEYTPFHHLFMTKVPACLPLFQHILKYFELHVGKRVVKQALHRTTLSDDVPNILFLFCYYNKLTEPDFKVYDYLVEKYDLNLDCKNDEGSNLIEFATESSPQLGKYLSELYVKSTKI